MNIDKNPWAPIELQTNEPWDVSKVAHLHRRAGFGATLAELERDLKAGPAASVERLLHPPDPTSGGARRRRRLARRCLERRRYAGRATQSVLAFPDRIRL